MTKYRCTAIEPATKTVLNRLEFLLFRFVADRPKNGLMLSVEEALARLLAKINPLPAELVPLAGASARICERDIRSPLDLPGFDNSAMDGYAVRAEDVLAAKQGAPVRLRVIGEVAAGGDSSKRLERLDAMRIFTGSPLPTGADAVVMQEETRRDGDFVDVLDPAKPFENVRLRGEDVRKGDLVAHAGDRLSAALVGVLSACGFSAIEAVRQPQVALLGTGNELCEPGRDLPPGHIYESNRSALAVLARDAGAVPRILPLVRDTIADTMSALEMAFQGADAVITSGGVSVGEHDHVKAAFERLGGKIEFWRVAMRPGKPFVFGMWNDKFLFGLPGNPVSAFVTFLVLVRPALLRMQRASDFRGRSVPGVLAETFRNEGDRRHFVRVIMDSEGMIRSAGPQASHRIGSLAKANGLIDLQPNSIANEGERIQVQLW